MQKSFAVIGMGRFGRCVAMELYNSGADVLVIDDSTEVINQMAEYVTCAICADVCDSESLKNAGISNMDAVIVAMADSLEPSIMSVMTAKELGVSLVVAKAKDEITGNILTKVGADRIVFPEMESGIRMSKKLMSDGFLDFFQISDTVDMVEMLPKKEWVGKSLKQLNLRNEYKINVVAIKDKDDVKVVMDPDEPLSAECPLLVTIKKTDLKRLM
jgi:trk system potassium uptake protein TrkA